MIEGRCRCGEVRYTLAKETLPPAYACHCHICQRWSGSAFSLNMLLAEDQLTVEGPVETLEIRTEDRVSSQRVCARCHARIYNTNTRRPGVAVLRAGTLDRSEELECRAHIFTAYRQRWFALPEDVPSWSEAPDTAAFMELLS